MLPTIGNLRPWADPRINQINRLPMHSTITREKRQSLDGEWSFNLFSHPDDIDAVVLKDLQRDKTVVVPGNWTMQDMGDFPHYTNVQMPFSGAPPELPERIATGVYRRGLAVPTDWRESQIVLSVGGAESVHAVFINGEFVGYGTDSHAAMCWRASAPRCAPASGFSNSVRMVRASWAASGSAQRSPWYIASPWPSERAASETGSSS